MESQSKPARHQAFSNMARGKLDQRDPANRSEIAAKKSQRGMKRLPFKPVLNDSLSIRHCYLFARISLPFAESRWSSLPRAILENAR